MLVDVTLLMEDAGRPLPRHRLAFLAEMPKYRGRFVYKEAIDRDLRRTLSCAWLKSVDGLGDVLPCLADAEILLFEGDELTVTGVEVLDPLSRRRTAQSWYCKIISL